MLYISCVISEYKLKEVYLKIDYDNCNKTNLTLKDKTILYSADLLQKPNNIQDLISMMHLIEYQCYFLNKYRDVDKLFDKINNVKGKVLELDLASFYVFLNSKLGLSNLNSPFIALGLIQFANNKEIEFRTYTYKKVAKFINKMIDFYDAENVNNKFVYEKKNKSIIDKLLFWKKSNQSKSDIMQKNIVSAMDENFNFFESNEEIQVALKFLQTKQEIEKDIKEKYNKYCEECLNGSAYIEQSDWGNLAKGMEYKKFYNPKLAESLYQKCLEVKNYEGCLSILNAVDYPVDFFKMRELINKFDGENFKDAYDQYLTNFGEKFKTDFYNCALKQCKQEKVQ